jgi:hypothetical protein
MAVYLEGQTKFGDVPWSREGSAGVFLDSTQPVAHGVATLAVCPRLSQPWTYNTGTDLVLVRVDLGDDGSMAGSAGLCRDIRGP